MRVTPCHHPLRLGLLWACMLLAAWPGVALSATPPGAAETTATSAGEPGAAELRALRERIADPQQREQLLEQLDALIRAQSAGDTGNAETGTDLLDRASDALSGFAAGLGQFLVLLEAAPELPRRLTAALADPDIRARSLQAAGGLAWLLGLGAAAFIASLVAVRGAIRAAHGRARDGWPFLAPIGRALLMVLPPLAAFIVVALVSRLAAVGEIVHTLAIATVTAFALSQLLLRTVGECVAPRIGDPLPPTPRDDGRSVMRWLRVLGVFTIVGVCAVLAAQELGLPRDSAWSLLRLLALVITLALAAVILRVRPAIAALIRGDARASGVRGQLAAIWHAFALILLAGLYVAIFVSGTAGAGGMLVSLLMTVVIFVVAVTLATGSRRLLARLLAGDARASSRFLLPLQRIVTAIVYGLGFIALLQIWGVPMVQWLRSSIGRSVAGTAVSLAVIVLATILVLEIATAVTEKILQRHQATGGAYGGVNARRQTLLPLVRNLIRTVVITVAALMILAEVGVNIGPLLAGAGIIGLAVGFGAQTLVQDVITGFFMLVEDTIAVGDWVDLGGGHDGEVESISIRSMRLRDLQGNIHTVPFSKVGSIMNMTRLFSYALLDIRVSYREDVDGVIDVLERIAQAMRDDEKWGPMLLAPLEVFGVNALDESWVEIRARLKTRPGDQWQIRRAFLQRTKEAFENAGIDIPYPQRILHFDRERDQGGSPAPAHVVIHRQDDPA